MPGQNGDTVAVYTDGACSGNPGPGGWAAIVISGDDRRELSGAERHTTNQRMEICAAIEGIKATPQTAEVALYSDSAYLINAFKQGWIRNWMRNGWVNSKKNPVENQDLWHALLAVVDQRRVSWHKVKGHANNELNNRCDQLAREAIRTLGA